MTLHQRHEAAERLAIALSALRDQRPFVLAIPRGGVVIGDVVARALRAPLDVLVAGKALAPSRDGDAIGAIAEGGAQVIDEPAVAALGLPPDEVERLLGVERRRQLVMLERMRGTWPLPELAGRTVVLVDDAIVTGLTMRAAIAAVRSRRVGRVVVAVPLGAIEAVAALAAVADEVVCSQTAPGPAAARMHDERQACPPIGDDQVHELVARELRDVGADPFDDLAIDGI